MSENNKVIITTTEKEFDYLPIAAGEYAIETGFDKLKRKVSENPLIPIGLLVTTGVLCNGIIQMAKGNRAKSQQMMRMRVLAQGSTVLALLGGMVFQYWNKKQPRTGSNNS